ncbi:MAG: hypothetical protein V7L14_24500 [Nostoc sp.]|uniref:hypothetical protein n=1 Tax=Nostoc sp. TaxID=1180 RepID=UPI002FF9B5F1
MNLVEQLQQVPDYRHIRGRRHELWLVLLLIFKGRGLPSSPRCDVTLCVVRSLTYINSLVITTSLALTLNI